MPAWYQIMTGQQRNWGPDSELCEMLVEVLCRSPRRLDRALELVRDDMPVRYVGPGCMGPWQHICGDSSRGFA